MEESALLFHCKFYGTCLCDYVQQIIFLPDSLIIQELVPSLNVKSVIHHDLDSTYID